MPLSKPEVALEFFGIDPEKYENDDAFREAAAKDWTKTAEAVKHPEIMKAVTGRANGVFEMKTRQAFKELEIPTDEVDFSVPAEAVIALAQRAKKTFTEKEAKLTESLKGKGSEEAKKEYERQLGELSKKATDYEGVISTLRGDLEARDKAEKEREVNGKINTAWELAKQTGLKDVQFKNDLEKTGFEAVAKQRFKVLFDEKGEQYWADAEGKRVQDGAKHQAFKDGPQLLKELAAELKVGNANPRAGERVGLPPQRTNERPTGEREPLRKLRPIAPPGRVLNDATK